MLPRELLLDDETGKGDLIADTEAEENAAGIEACGAVRIQQNHECDALDEKVRARADPAIDAVDEEAGADAGDYLFQLETRRGCDAGGSETYAIRIEDRKSTRLNSSH